jgi:hypothetical protein
LVIESEGREFHYGITREDMENLLVENPDIERQLKNISRSFKSNKWWCVYKLPDRYQLDFVTCNSPEFEELKDPRKRDKFIDELAEEIDGYAKKLGKSWEV